MELGKETLKKTTCVFMLLKAKGKNLNLDGLF